jgi:signal transduction histidine kinase
MTPAAGALVLNVDDDEPSRYAKSRMLRAAGFEVIEAATGSGALEMVRERMPALVLLDVKLPDIGGREVCARLKADPATAQILVLQTSASHIDVHHRVASLDAGADGYLVEPMEPEELVAIVRALMRLRQAESERQAALEALREADRRKDEFLAMLAHELRNPLAPIRNAVEILKSPDPAMRERARLVVGRQAEHLARLVDDLLEVSRITQRKVTLQPDVVALASVVEAAAETVRPLVESRRLKLELKPVTPDLYLEVDAVRLAQVIGNLLHNAAKFSGEEGRIELQSGVSGDSIAIRVADSGAGIAPDVLPHVFDLFTQGERSLERSQGGLGIGLSLVKGLVEMHGGTVSAESRGIGKGSAFTVRLPLSLRRAAPMDARAAEAVATGRHRVLVVEDNVDAAEAMLMLLTQEGHDVTVIHDGAEAVECARNLRPDTVLLDIGLPGINGYDLAARLREMPETRDARLIAVSGYGQKKDLDRSAQAGFDLHLVKPVDPAQLRRIVGAVSA